MPHVTDDCIPQNDAVSPNKWNGHTIIVNNGKYILCGETEALEPVYMFMSKNAASGKYRTPGEGNVNSRVIVHRQSWIGEWMYQKKTASERGEKLKELHRTVLPDL
jgi:hypothetical protein